ncbi:NUDIX hydrolase YfcD [Metapseudomonas otitidis]|uniref:NUDIX hydrolase YfcD n=1 Tax=Metapseudomonas otitidis TaxID=319939 RepID=UPI00209B3726|nr:NUDIX hydrolase YfcD [Pseudomonas otitidis]MCO7557274.1 NUDIX hydrolase YfcD [Pseudomonas otitidis]
MALDPREAAHRAASDAERVAWVDEQDRLLGGLPRAELRERGLVSRGTFILLFNSAGQLCVHRRTLSKALYPGYWDVAAGGMVQEGEDYALSATRELEEELGIAGVPLREHGRFYFDEPGNRLWGAVFSAVSDAPLRLQPEEVMEARFMSLDEAQALENCCPDSLKALRLYLASL